MSFGSKLYFYWQVALFESLLYGEKEALVDGMYEHSFKDGDVICKQGDKGESFFIISQGTCICKATNEMGEETILKTLTRGQFFGERALLKDEPRAATVAVSDKHGATVLCISREAFNVCIGPLQQINEQAAEAAKKGMKVADYRKSILPTAPINPTGLSGASDRAVDSGAAHGVASLVERFDIEPFPDFSAK